MTQTLKSETDNMVNVAYIGCKQNNENDGKNLRKDICLCYV